MANLYLFKQSVSLIWYSFDLLLNNSNLVENEHMTDIKDLCRPSHNLKAKKS